ncbi:uncharacterized protein LOC143353457 [Halictus rubicundus]|uniref:uncharacterized protein LOC143353457 n=1 Tax=Halictus rubicundus TaxID=77578 RepID=UPI004036ED86
MRKLPAEQLHSSDQSYYIPHHAVFRESSSTTSLRVVFNASCGTTNGQSLNDHLSSERSKLQGDLIAILLRWRQSTYVYAADIAKMYRQIQVNEHDLNYQRILWRTSPTEPVTECQLGTVTYGTSSAPFQALGVIKQLTVDEGQRFPLAAPILQDQTYVDDCLFGADIPDLLRRIRDQLIALLQAGGFRLRKWASNTPSLLDDIDPSDHGLASTEPISVTDTISILGIAWIPVLDRFQIRLHNPIEPTNTKRAVLSAGPIRASYSPGSASLRRNGRLSSPTESPKFKRLFLTRTGTMFQRRTIPPIVHQKVSPHANSRLTLSGGTGQHGLKKPPRFGRVAPSTHTPNHNAKRDPSPTPAWSRFPTNSMWHRATPRGRRIIKRLRSPPRGCTTTALLPNEVASAKIHWLKRIQADTFPQELCILAAHGTVPKSSPLSSLNLYLDSHGLIRAKGRLSKAQLPTTTKEPIILRSHPLLSLLIHHIHHTHLHAGPQLTLACLRHEYWILRARATVRAVLYGCVPCTREQAAIPHQLMGHLPASRTTRTERAFIHTGVDYAGPIQVRTVRGRGHKAQKAYIAVFVCLTTKAIHLEVVSDYLSAAFLAAYHRFVSRRGLPRSMTSDNGTTSHGANRELTTAYRTATRDTELQYKLAIDGVSWHFLPPTAPHFGGLWGASVKSVKHHLNRCIGTHTLTFEVLSTFLCRVEACLNSRPIASTIIPTGAFLNRCRPRRESGTQRPSPGGESAVPIAAHPTTHGDLLESLDKRLPADTPSASQIEGQAKTYQSRPDRPGTQRQHSSEHVGTGQDRRVPSGRRWAGSGRHRENSPCRIQTPDLETLFPTGRDKRVPFHLSERDATNTIQIVLPISKVSPRRHQGPFNR